MEGWITNPTSGWRTVALGGTGSGQAYTLSLAEIVKGFIPAGEGSGAENYSWNNMTGIQAAVSRNIREFGAQGLATVVVTPIAAKLLKRVARAPIRDANKLLKWSGIQSALGVKI